MTANQGGRYTRPQRNIFIGTSVAAFALAPTGAHAQQTTDSGLLEEVTVTANRVESAIERTPTAITALTSDSLANARITNPTELQGRVPGLSIDRSGGAGGLQITIRGVSSSDLTEKGDPSAAFLLDGIYIARPQVQEVSFYDLERVEVLRGPQGTLYGRNTTAGLVNVISARPKQEFGASADVVVGDFGTRQVTGMVNTPLGETTAMRVAVNYDRRDSYLIANPASPFDLDPSTDNLSGRMSFLFEPSDSLEVLLRADYSRIQGSNRTVVPASNLFQFPLVVPADGQPGTDPVYLGGSSDGVRTLPYVDARQDDIDNDTWGFMADVSWDLSDSLTLNYLGSYREFTRDEAFSTFAGTVPAAPPIYVNVPSTFTGDYSQNSQELRLAYKNDSLQLQAGLYYFREESDIEFLLIGLLAPNPGIDGYVFGFPQSPTIAESTAAFAQGTFNLTDVFRLTAGVRYTEDDKSRVGNTILHANINEPVNYTPGPNNPAPDSLNNASANFSKSTWRAGLEYDLSNSTLLYATVATGYKAGGFNDGCLSGTANCNNPTTAQALFYDPEELTSYELGAKVRFDNVQVFASYFHYDYTDLQVSALGDFCGGPCTVTSNAAEAEVDGVEVEAEFVPSESHHFDAQIAWLDAKFSDYPIAPGVNLAGTAMSRSPEWVIGGGYTYTMFLAKDSTLAFNIHSRYSDEYFFVSSALRSSFRQPSYSKTDVTLTYRAAENRWYVGAFVNNIEDEVTLGSVGTVPAFPGLNNGEAALAAPRTYGLRGGFNF